MENEPKEFLEYNIDFENEENFNEEILAGTLTRPKEDGRYPAVLIIPGAGATDRNGTLTSLNIDTNMYLDLAHLIAKLGFVTLRYDKRGVGESQGERINTGMWDLVSDILAAIAFLKEQPFVDPEKIILLGHSEGSMLATAANAKCPVCGLILISNAAETLEDSSRWQRQLTYNEFNAKKGFSGVVTRLSRIQTVDKTGEKEAQKFYKKIMESSEDIMKIKGQQINAKWFREHYQHDLFGDLHEAVCPILAIVGDKDFQSNPENVKKIGAYVPGETQVHVIENMDHIMKEFEGDYKPSQWQQNYRAGADKPLHPELQKILTDWLNEKFN